MHLGPYSPSLPLGPLALLLLPHGLAMQRHDTGHKDEKERVRAETENERVGPRCIECKVHALKTARATNAPLRSIFYYKYVSFYIL